MSNKKYRKIVRYKDYFDEFFMNQVEIIQKKIIWTLELIEDIENVPKTYLKSITNVPKLFEIRIKHGTNIFRVFCFFYEGNLVVLMNGFQKKKQKTPKSEIKKAVKIMKAYERDNQ